MTRLGWDVTVVTDRILAAEHDPQVFGNDGSCLLSNDQCGGIGVLITSIKMPSEVNKIYRTVPTLSGAMERSAR